MVSNKYLMKNNFAYDFCNNYYKIKLVKGYNDL